MQTKLRILGLMIVANALWISPTPAAPMKAMKAKTPTAANRMKLSFVGTASWYGQRHQGRKMANGKRFDSHKLTAASWYFPLGTNIRVVNLKNGESVVVTITDRGPGQSLHRIVDLSEAAAQRLDYVGQGLTSVFLYPMVSVQTEAAPLDIHLVEPGTVKTAGNEVAAASMPM